MKSRTEFIREALAVDMNQDATKLAKRLKREFGLKDITAQHVHQLRSNIRRNPSEQAKITALAAKFNEVQEKLVDDVFKQHKEIESIKSTVEKSQCCQSEFNILCDAVIDFARVNNIPNPEEVPLKLMAIRREFISTSEQQHREYESKINEIH